MPEILVAKYNEGKTQETGLNGFHNMTFATINITCSIVFTVTFFHEKCHIWRQFSCLGIPESADKT